MRATRTLRTAAAAAAAADIAAPCCSGAQTGCSARLEVMLPSARLEDLRRGLGRAFVRVGVQVSALSELVRGRGLQRWGGDSRGGARRCQRPREASQACSQACRTEIEILTVEISPVEIDKVHIDVYALIKSRQVLRVFYYSLL